MHAIKIKTDIILNDFIKHVCVYINIYIHNIHTQYLFMQHHFILMNSLLQSFIYEGCRIRRCLKSRTHGDWKGLGNSIFQCMHGDWKGLDNSICQCMHGDWKGLGICYSSRMSTILQGKCITK